MPPGNKIINIPGVRIINTFVPKRVYDTIIQIRDGKHPSRKNQQRLRGIVEALTYIVDRFNEQNRK